MERDAAEERGRRALAEDSHGPGAVGARERKPGGLGVVPHGDDDGVLGALFALALCAREPRHRVGDEHARRVFFDAGFAALCRAGHPIRRTGEDHLALFQLLDWPRRDGRTIAEELLLGLARGPGGTAPSFVDAALVRSLARARLTLVRATSRAGERMGFEDLASGGAAQARMPPGCAVDVGDTLLTRFADTRLGHRVPIVDLLVVPHGALRRLRDLWRASDGPRGPDARSTDAARLFRAWGTVALGDARGVIDPLDHASALGGRAP